MDRHFISVNLYQLLQNAGKKIPLPASRKKYLIRTWLRQSRKYRQQELFSADRKQGTPICIYRQAGKGRTEGEEQLFHEASEQGVGVIMISGDEPLHRPDTLWRAGAQQDIIFPVFTNGKLLRGYLLRIFREHHNLFPVICAGPGRSTAETTGAAGEYLSILQRMEHLKTAGQPFGMSFTLNRQNFEEITSKLWMRTHMLLGSSVFFLGESAKQSREDLNLQLSQQQRDCLPKRIRQLRKQVPALIVQLPH